MSSRILEVLKSLGALEEDERQHVDKVRGAVRWRLSDPENDRHRVLAYSLYSAEFDHPYSQEYWEVIHSPAANERKMLFQMAAHGADDMLLYLDLLLIDLASFGDPAVGRCIARWTALSAKNSFLPHEAIETFMAAHLAPARLGCPLPDRRAEADGDWAEALLACGAILYWINRTDLSASQKRHACDAPVQVLVRHARGAELDVVRHCEQALLECVEDLPGAEPVVRSIVNSFPSEVAEICRRALEGPTREVGYFQQTVPHDTRKNLKLALDVLARHGTCADLPLLRRYAEDPHLGERAVEAVRTLEEPRASG